MIADPAIALRLIASLAKAFLLSQIPLKEWWQAPYRCLEYNEVPALRSLLAYRWQGGNARHIDIDNLNPLHPKVATGPAEVDGFTLFGAQSDPLLGSQQPAHNRATASTASCAPPALSISGLGSVALVRLHDVVYDVLHEEHCGYSDSRMGREPSRDVQSTLLRCRNILGATASDDVPIGVAIANILGVNSKAGEQSSR